ncbi:MAG: hypothetical protein HYZ85_03655 [Candidatus Omnitrophica bacterium]|nr:hypothetical protein [Candidatus Omnitrophota bacterium]
MEKSEITAIIEKLLEEIEEEDIGISLLTTHFQNQEELDFFQKEDKERVIHILEKLAEDSKRHKNILEKIISHLGDIAREK